MHELITFRLGSELYGIEVSNVREILTYPGITKLPNTNNWVLGVINLRGEVTPVIDLRIRFNTTENPVFDKRTIVIAAKTKDMRMVGIVVDSVEDMENVETEQLSSAPEMGTSIKDEYVKGLIKKEDKMIVLMDIDRLLDKEELESLALV